MVQRVNITLPDVLHQRLQVFKEDLNISAICKEALEREVILREAKAKAMSTREEVIAKLKSQAENEFDEWYQDGKQKGLNAAPDLNYADFVVISDWIDGGEDAGELPIRNEDFGWIVESAERCYCPERFRPKYFAGFVDGILEFWNDIKDEVEPKTAY